MIWLTLIKYRVNWVQLYSNSICYKWFLYISKEGICFNFWIGFLWNIEGAYFWQYNSRKKTLPKCLAMTSNWNSSHQLMVNPPFSKNVQNNIGARFLQPIDKHSHLDTHWSKKWTESQWRCPYNVCQTWRWLLLDTTLRFRKTDRLSTGQGLLKKL